MFHSLQKYFFKYLPLVLIGLLVIFIVLKNSEEQAPAASLKKIAITQIVAHSSLDKVRQGIVDELATAGYQDGKTAKILFQNAQGNLAIAAQIAQSFVASVPDVMVGIATPSAQSLVNAARKTSIPVVFATVTDPIKAKLVTNLSHPDNNVTGTRNVTPVKQELALIQKILPQTKTLGIIINYSEENSVDLLQLITKEAKNFNITVQAVGVNSSAEVQAATASLVGKADAVLLLQDNTVAQSLPAVLGVAQKNNLPIFSTYLDAVKMGALAGLACDEYQLGRQTGKMIVKILQGTKANELPVEDPAKIDLAINTDTAKRLHLVISPELIKQAKMDW